jgi:capsular exopolysaccharide synthesis family protein
MMPNPNHGPSPGSDHLPAVVSPVRADVLSVSMRPPRLPANPDPIALLKPLRRRFRLAVSTGLLGGVLTALAVYFLVPQAKYMARAMLHVNSIRPKILLQVGESSTDYGAYQRTQLALLRSRLVLNAALKQPGVARLKVVARQIDPIEWLDKELQVDFAQGSEILRISMPGDTAEEPMVLVNAVTQAYMDEVVDVEAKQRRERYDLLKETWNRYQETLREKRKELKRLTELAGSDNKATIANIHQHELDRVGRAEDVLAQIRSELRSLRVEQEVLQAKAARNAAMISPATIENAINEDASMEAYHERVALAQKHFDQVSRITRIASDPALSRHRAELEAARTALAARRKKLYPIIAQQLQGMARNEDLLKADSLQDRISVLSKLETELIADVERLSERSRSLTRNSLDLFSNQEEIANADEVAKVIGKEVEALSVELQAPPRIRLLEKAELPHTKDEKRQIKLAGMAGCGALALVLAGVSFWEFRAQRIDSAEEVVHSLGMKLVGTLPALPLGRSAPAARDAEILRQENLLIESVDAARTTLLHISRTESIRTVMVASALGAEGKTSLSCHLATSLARAGRRTLLIDGDLRRPTAHRLFDLPQGPGLSEVLRGEVEITEVAMPALADGLWLVPAGNSDGAAIRALACKDLRAMLDPLKENYDFIVVDSSPVLPVADALLIGQHVDAVLLSVMRDVSRLPKVHAAGERLSALGIPVLGAIVTGARCDRYGDEYQYADRDREPA